MEDTAAVNGEEATGASKRPHVEPDQENDAKRPRLEQGGDELGLDLSDEEDSGQDEAMEDSNAAPPPPPAPEQPPEQPSEAPPATHTQPDHAPAQQTDTAHTATDAQPHDPPHEPLAEAQPPAKQEQAPAESDENEHEQAPQQAHTHEQDPQESAPPSQGEHTDTQSTTVGDTQTTTTDTETAGDTQEEVSQVDPSPWPAPASPQAEAHVVPQDSPAPVAAHSVPEPEQEPPVPAEPVASPQADRQPTPPPPADEPVQPHTDTPVHMETDEPAAPVETHEEAAPSPALATASAPVPKPEPEPEPEPVEAVAESEDVAMQDAAPAHAPPPHEQAAVEQEQVHVVEEKEVPGHGEGNSPKAEPVSAEGAHPPAGQHPEQQEVKSEAEAGQEKDVRRVESEFSATGKSGSDSSGSDSSDDSGSDDEHDDGGDAHSPAADGDEQNGQQQGDDDDGAPSTASVGVQVPVFRVPERRTTNQLYFLENTVMKTLWRHKDSWPFQKPVDWQTLNIPDYPEIVKHPMDLGHVKRRLEAREYKSAEECIADIGLVFSNCRLYNPPGSDVVVMCDRLAAMFARKLEKMPKVEKELSAEEEAAQWAGLMGSRASASAKKKKGGRPKKSSGAVKRPGGRPPGAGPRQKKPKLGAEAAIELPPPLPKRQSVPPQPLLATLMESAPKAKGASKKGTGSKRAGLGARLRYCSDLLKDMLSKKHYAYAYPFYEPVEPSRDGCPDYYDVIKKPMDLGTIRGKMDRREYTQPNEFADDVRLMFTNCYRYNSKDNEVFQMGRKLQDYFEVRYALMPAQDGPDLLYDGTTTDGGDEPARSGSGKKKSGKKSIKDLKHEFELKAQAEAQRQREKEMQLRAKREEKEKRQREKEQAKASRQKQKEKERMLKQKQKEQKEKEKKKKRKKDKEDARPSSKKDKKASKKQTPTKQTKKSSKKGGAAPMNFNEKRALSNAINRLPPQKVPKILEIIQRHMKLSSTPQEEIEIDIDSLSAAALRELEAYVNSVNNKPQKTKAAKAPPSKKQSKQKPPPKKSSKKAASSSESESSSSSSSDSSGSDSESASDSD